MNVNVDTLERLIRIAIGILLLSLPFWLESPWRWFSLIGVMPLLTGLAGRCPAYTRTGRNTCRLRKDEP